MNQPYLEHTTDSGAHERRYRFDAEFGASVITELNGKSVVYLLRFHGEETWTCEIDAEHPAGRPHRLCETEAQVQTALQQIIAALAA